MSKFHDQHYNDDFVLNRLFRRRSKKTSKLRVIGVCVGNSPVTGDFPAQMASNAENVSIWWRNDAVLAIVLIGWLGQYTEPSIFVKSIYLIDWCRGTMLEGFLWIDNNHISLVMVISFFSNSKYNSETGI